MKKTLQRLGIVTVGLSLCLWSCKEQDGILKPEDATSNIKVAPKIKENIDFSVVEGRLKFETMEDFKAALTKTSTQQEIESWEKRDGFTSLNENYKEFFNEDSDGVKGVNRVISKDYEDAVEIRIDKVGRKNYERTLSFLSLATLTNQEGMVQIADKILKFSNQQVKIAKAEFIQDLRSDIKSSNVEVNKVIEGSDTKGNKTAKVLSDFDSYDDRYYNIPSGYANRKFVIHKRVNAYNLGWWGTFTYLWIAGVNIEHQRDNWYGWGSCDIDSWSWDGGSCSVVPQPNTNINQSTLYGWSSPNWGGSSTNGGSSIFLGQFGSFESNTTALGTFSVTYNLSIGQVTGYTFGPQGLGGLSFNAGI